MIFDETENIEQLRRGLHLLLEEAQQVYGISMSYTKQPDGEEYLDWTVRDGFDHTPAIVWMCTCNRYRWLFVYQKMLWHRVQEFIPHGKNHRKTLRRTCNDSPIFPTNSTVPSSAIMKSGL